MATVELQGQGAAERYPSDLRPLQLDRGEELGKAVGVLRQTEVLRWIGGAAGAGSIPGHHGEFVGQVVDTLISRSSQVLAASTSSDSRTSPIIGYVDVPRKSAAGY
jgi:hypothetical protein